MNIRPVESKDLSFIYHLFDCAIVYQKRNGYPVWPDYDKEVLIQDISDGRMHKIIIDEQIANIFSICYSDPIVWRERNKDKAVYLHRIVTNPEFKGIRLMNAVMSWTIKHARTNDIPLIRLDTWAQNDTLVDYYKEFGFTIVEYFTTPNTKDLPIQQRGNNVVLMERSADLNR